MYVCMYIYIIYTVISRSTLLYIIKYVYPSYYIYVYTLYYTKNIWYDNLITDIPVVFSAPGWPQRQLHWGHLHLAAGSSTQRFRGRARTSVITIMEDLELSITMGDPP